MAGEINGCGFGVGHLDALAVITEPFVSPGQGLRFDFFVTWSAAGSEAAVSSTWCFREMFFTRIAAAPTPLRAPRVTGL
jgi:hypothetical protein